MSAASNPLVSSEVRSESGIQILAITMHQDGKFNPTSLAEFNAALDILDSNSELQCLMISGEEKSFAQGLDLEYLTSAPPDEAQAFVDHCMVMIGRLLVAPVPVVSAINGHAFGLGAMIVLASDYTAMREDRGYFCLPEVDLGMVLIPSMNALVKNKLSARAARDSLLAGARIGAADAQSLGIIDQTSPLDQLFANSLALAAQMIGKDRNTLSGLKRGLNDAILPIIESALNTST